MAQHPDGARVRHRERGSEHALVRRMPPNTAVGREHEETEPVYELDDGSLAPHSLLELLEHAENTAHSSEE